MGTGRQDAWTIEEDRLLADLVLSHIRDGSTQLKAFKEAAAQLARTPAACGFRWNSFVRKNYQDEIAAAKQQRKKIQKTSPFMESGTGNGESPQLERLSIQDIITYLRGLQDDREENHLSYSAVKEENRKLKHTIDQLYEKLEETQKKYSQLQAEYSNLLSIMDKARKLADQAARKETSDV
ncbi:RsfA family transcriptional regulator [Siminovitchia sediminis]|uniref:RsfA family transcriptional regulator n=1 Tax=Siminovitchia sediminis TaxID=1274353 RepID=A0ABW4KC79_9BACI